MKPDKGNGVVIMDRAVYSECLLDIVKDTKKFRKCNTDPTLFREGQLQRFLRTLKKKGFFTNDAYDKIYPKGSKPARIYGLPKMHKFKESDSRPSFRPIVSSIGTFNYNLSKFLCNLLSPHIPTEYAAKDTFTFVNEMQKVSSSNSFMVSFDVCSLFTNIPLEETIDIAVNVILENNVGIKITKKELKQLFIYATSKTHFLFNDSIYDQIDGVAMGSPLAPVLANLFMGHYEHKWIQG